MTRLRTAFEAQPAMPASLHQTAANLQAWRKANAAAKARATVAPPSQSVEVEKVKPASSYRPRGRPTLASEDTWHLFRYPRSTVIVVGTINKVGLPEFRVGVVKERDFIAGLRLDDGHLNPPVAHRCFGESAVYTDEVEAEQVARGLFSRMHEQELQREREQKSLLPPARDPKIEMARKLEAEMQAQMRAHKAVGAIKILHLPYPWPPRPRQ